MFPGCYSVLSHCFLFLFLFLFHSLAQDQPSTFPRITSPLGRGVHLSRLPLSVTKGAESTPLAASRHERRLVPFITLSLSRPAPLSLFGITIYHFLLSNYRVGLLPVPTLRGPYLCCRPTLLSLPARGVGGVRIAELPPSWPPAPSPSWSDAGPATTSCPSTRSPQLFHIKAAGRPHLISLVPLGPGHISSTGDSKPPSGEDSSCRLLKVLDVTLPGIGLSPVYFLISQKKLYPTPRDHHLALRPSA